MLIHFPLQSVSLLMLAVARVPPTISRFQPRLLGKLIPYELIPFSRDAYERARFNGLFYLLLSLK